ncbi:uncharacterized protein LOC106665722 isoform X2 [Cimex lectularius]|uniref:E3 ubiquitin-protein ligase APD1-4 middle domain-containing protein n=1 Tax=Cimex lectularius TaxID=79782 RepID=A0A8I6RME6_CIMLE|nr:uncharacterized protein LOC106665722 isoform X2 [Cimex lectularius]
MQGQELEAVKYYHSYTNSSFSQLHRLGKMQGARRVIFFCIMVVFLPIVLILTPLYLRHNLFSDIKYPVAESDIIEMVNGISSVFCQEHTLKMNTPFNAFQAKGKPVMSTTVKKHIQLKKSMSLPDDTLEYWGFFLPKSSKVYLSMCSRQEGSAILIVKGEKTLRDCGLLQPTKLGGHFSADQGSIVVKYVNADVVEQVQSKSSGEEVVDDYETNSTHNRKLPKDLKSRQKALELELNGDKLQREKRQIPTNLLDGGIAHGGNAVNNTENNESSMSSFENTLLTCYTSEEILLSKKFPHSSQCTATSYLETGTHMKTTHEIASDGYYYYIFYSDNDWSQNDIYAIFDIYKPTYQYGNYTIGCINQTNCSFPVEFWSDDIIVVEVPTRNGIENENDDITILTSICHPRTVIYAIFPISVLFIIVMCAFQ